MAAPACQLAALLCLIIKMTVGNHTHISDKMNFNSYNCLSADIDFHPQINKEINIKYLILLKIAVGRT